MKLKRLGLTRTALLSCMGIAIASPAFALVEIDRADWDSGDRRLRVEGNKDRRATVTVVNAFAPSQVIGTDNDTDDRDWRVRSRNPSPVPCRVRAINNLTGETAERDVRNAPANCAPDGPTEPPTQPPETGDVSINSTSANSADAGVDPNDQGPVPEQPFAGNTGYKILAINDLGMHCGDLDTRISSILPPFQVLLAQVIRMGGEPDLLGPGQAEVVYSAVSSPNDPALGLGGQLCPDANGNLNPCTSVYKTNFWDVAFQGYDPFYPDGVLELFYDPENPGANVDIGLPVPNVEEFYLGSGELVATQHDMPGRTGPYLDNAPQVAEEFYNDKPFFMNFPFGYVADNLNWFEAAGVPLAAFDDFGRENPYPLVRVQARVNGQTVATTDTVLPISGEAECQACHAAPADGGNGSAVAGLPDNEVTTSLDDPAHGSVPNAVSVEWASDRNILRLHDRKHDTTLAGAFDPITGRALEPVVCQRCHYTPALDLAQLGPLGPENDFAAEFENSGVPGGIIPSPSVANGRDQIKHKSMSNVMHSHHADVRGTDGSRLFPDMPPAIDGQGNRRDGVTTQTVLEETCYMCHPGKRTQCMRGAMANGGLVCQDCHGQMAQVGDDFSRGVSPDTPGAFELAADFYTNPDTPRVPWANEPGCGSCHTGDVRNNLAGSANVLVNPTDTFGNADGIRLLAAYRTNDTKATPIVPTNNRFAENEVNGGPADGNPKLYRVSTGHGGVMCEGCHGATHAEWPNADPNANDNIAATQLQGHTGTIIECTTCHGNALSRYEGLGGPHGMHVVGANTDFADGGHEDLAEDNPNACRACHGNNGEGSVLSRAAADRDFRGLEDGGIVPKGEPVTCFECHDNEL